MPAFSPLAKSLCLHRVCEANFERLLCLAPDLMCLEGSVTARVPGRPDLHLHILERSPYTLVMQLTHEFASGYRPLLEPGVRIRVSLDARTAEMLSDHVRPVVPDALRDAPTPADVLNYKWQLNYFLSRWLDHCLIGDYRFEREPRPAADMAALA